MKANDETQLKYASWVQALGDAVASIINKYSEYPCHGHDGA